MSSKMSESIANIASNLVSFIYAILWCIFFSWIFSFKDIYSSCRLVVQLLTRLFLHMSKRSRDLSRMLYLNNKISTSKSRSERKTIANNTSTSVSIEDIEIVFENLGLNYDDRKGNGRHNMTGQGSNIELASVFDRVQPCSDELKEAFNIFDGNKDGFIDASELEKVINSMGVMEFSKEEYQRMIVAFDDDGDGKIGFGEFVKLMEDSFC